MVSYKDGRNNMTTYEYDSMDRPTKTINPDNTYKTYSYGLRSLSEVDENGNKTSYTFNGLGHLKELSAPDKHELIKYFYDHRMRVEIQRDEKNNAEFEWSFDALGRIVHEYQIKIAENNDTSMPYSASYSYEDAINSNESRVIKTMTGTTPAPTIKMATYYDNIGRAIKESIWNGNTEHISRYKYDAFDNLREELTAQNAADGYLFTNKYKYDHAGAGRLLELTNADNKTFKYEYDWLGRKINQTDFKNNNENG